jgi:hypothetical protein
MESGATRGVDDGGLDRPASDVAGVPVAADATPYERPRGTYNCPVCGWNVPHREHAGEVIEQLCFELNAWKAWWQHVVLMLKSGIRPGCSVSQAKLNCDELVAGRGASSPAPFISPMFDKPPYVPAASDDGAGSKEQKMENNMVIGRMSIHDGFVAERTHDIEHPIRIGLSHGGDPLNPHTPIVWCELSESQCASLMAHIAKRGETGDTYREALAFLSASGIEDESVKK